MHSVSFSRREGEWVVRGQLRRGGVNGELLLFEEELPMIGAAELRRALLNEQEFNSRDHAAAAVSHLPEAHFDADGPTQPIGFEVVSGQLMVTVMCFTEWPEDGNESEAIRRMKRLVEPLVARQKAIVDDVSTLDWASAPTHLAVGVRIAAKLRGRTAADFYMLGLDVERLRTAFDSAGITRETVADLVRGGGAELLIDQPEGNWLDAKAQEYDLSTLRGRLSMAHAVSRFANAEEGGLIVIGAYAKKVPGGEIIRQVRGVVPRQNDTAARYLRVLDQHLYPPVFGLRVDVVDAAADRALILVDVPPQPQELKPFLVHGAILADGSTEGSFISIVQRRGEGSIPVTAPMIHASIAAGQALLRGQHYRLDLVKG